MNKRSFIKLSLAMIAGRAMPIALAGQTSDRLKNWAGNLEYGTDRLYSATSLGQVRDYVRSQRNVKVLGTRHCFNNIADTAHNLPSLRPLDEVVELNSNARTVTTGAGITYGQLSPYLHNHGFALHNLASLPHISVAGACSTASHGSGDTNGNLSTAVSALEFVTASSELLEYSRQRDGEKFLGTIVGLGTMGVITKVTLDIQPTFLMQQYVYENLPLSELVHNFDAIESSAYSVSLFTDWQKRRVNEVWLKSRLEPGRSFRAVPAFFGAKLASKNMHPIAELSPENCTEQLGGEKELAPFNPRPHWGKLFTMSPATLRSRYETLPDFIQLAANHDPQGKFRNEFLNKNIFDS
jgi:xylitol oxidase